MKKIEVLELEDRNVIVFRDCDGDQNEVATAGNMYYPRYTVAQILGIDSRRIICPDTPIAEKGGKKEDLQNFCDKINEIIQEEKYEILKNKEEEFDSLII